MIDRDGYRARVRSWGCTPARPSVNNHTLHQTRDGAFVRIPDPEFLTDEELEPVLDLLEKIHGLTRYC